ncbi:MAG: [FeFe] hydrogenase H-cluster radical SAM maturase HydE [bacterium]|nr:[FeFe] hydrogenase H-cluster radical SAM maturase HydE [bacterium]
MTPSRMEILTWLSDEKPADVAALRARADDVRQAEVGDEIHLRGLVELSNHCIRKCGYCGIRAGNPNITRYRMSAAEVMACATRARELGLGTVVLQSGEDPGLDAEQVAHLIRSIKAMDLAVSLSLGERSDDELRLWRAAGADRYLLRFETSNEELYARVHPDHPGRSRDRLEQLRRMRRLGYEIGTGMLVGLPGQTREDLVDDIMVLGDLDPDMIGIGPFLPHPDTPLGQEMPGDSPTGQVPNTSGITCNVVALARLVCPQANIPSTTALATLDPVQGRESALSCGANVIMPNLTPARYRSLYEIYPGKATPAGECGEEVVALQKRLIEIGRPASVGRGDSPAWLARSRSHEEGGTR